LLVFDDLPRSTQSEVAHLDFQLLFEKGRTVQYQDLPERLWAATGIRLPHVDLYLRFGRLRNAIQHFAPPKINPSRETLDFIFRVLDPFIHDTWGLYAIDFNEEGGDHYEHVFETLVEQDIRPLISPDAAKSWRSLGYEPGTDAPGGYSEWFEAAMRAALADAT
jgi:hypothetical protein